MKRILCGVLCMLIGAGAMATEWPGWKCTDVQKIEAAKQSFLEEKNEYKALEMDVLAILAKKAPQSFADIEAAVDSIQKPETWSEKRFNSWRKTSKKHFACREEFVSEAWEFCKNNPGLYDCNFVFYHSNELGLDNEYIYHFIVDFITRHPDHLKMHKLMKTLLDVSINIDRTVVKTDLQKLNTIFSRKLLEDKTKWEPIVAEIRTVLETY